MAQMRTVERPRHYLSPLVLDVMRPVLRYSHGRDAFVLRFVGRQRGPVLRPDRRRRQVDYRGPERRGTEVGETYSEQMALP